MPLRSTNHNIKKYVITCVVFVLVTGFIAWLMPRGLGLYYQVKAGNLLDTVLGAKGNAESVTDFCFHQPLSDEEQSLLREASTYLKKSIAFNPQASHSYLLLGRVYCLLDSPADAVDNYEAYTQLRPENPLGHLELGFGYEAACQMRSDISAETRNGQASYAACHDSEMQARIMDEWTEAGVVVDQFVVEGDRAFSSQDYNSATRWYQRGAFFGDTLPSSVVFKWSVAAVLTGRQLPEVPDPNAVIVHLVSESTQIEAEYLQWVEDKPRWDLKPGDRLIDYPSSDRNVGVMWWAGVAVAIVEVPQQATYEITIRAKDTPPGPIKLQIERDFIPIDQFALTEGDEAWQELKTATVLSAGMHTIGIRFLKDNGDAVLDWILVEKVRNRE